MRIGPAFPRENIIYVEGHLNDPVSLCSQRNNPMKMGFLQIQVQSPYVKNIKIYSGVRVNITAAYPKLCKQLYRRISVVMHNCAGRQRHPRCRSAPLPPLSVQAQTDPRSHAVPPPDPSPPPGVPSEPKKRLSRISGGSPHLELFDPAQSPPGSLGIPQPSTGWGGGPTIPPETATLYAKACRSVYLNATIYAQIR